MDNQKIETTDSVHSRINFLESMVKIQSDKIEYLETQVRESFERETQRNKAFSEFVGWFRKTVMAT